MTIRSDWCWDLIDVFAFIKGLAARVKHESGELVLGLARVLFCLISSGFILVGKLSGLIQ